MVVGDDDQTIYEWRGARPNYILREFVTVFSNKPHADYTLSRSFRFGPVLAQSAQNVISFNNNRLRKLLIAHTPATDTHLDILYTSSEQPTDVNKELARQVMAIVRECKDPRKVIVLARMFSQLSGLEAELLSKGIPYRVLGRSPFFERRELCVLLDYIRLAMILDRPVDRLADKSLKSVANTPNRKLSREILGRTMELALLRGATTRAALQGLVSEWDSPLSRVQRERVGELLELLDRVQERIIEQTDLRAGDMLAWLVEALGYLKHFDDYYGRSENSEDRKRAVGLFCGYAQSTGLGVLDFVHHVEQLDPTLGRPEEEQIVMTTVFRTKGLEYDYVVIPNCDEGYMPCLFETGNLVFDKAGLVKEPEPSEIIENERRLFYVAITRARKGVLVGASTAPTKGSQGKSPSSRPSRFLAEIQREPTVAVMGPLQRLAAGDSTARSELRTQAARYGGVKAVMDNLLTQYFPALKEYALARELESIAARLPALPFTYPQLLDNTSLAAAPLTSFDRNAPKLRWWEREDD
jgi:DNA helicase-2/ATP-dependent DNA helicase PcrA